VEVNRKQGKLGKQRELGEMVGEMGKIREQMTND
jgi:hypothetical protein